jgi:hypothetical protein
MPPPSVPSNQGFYQSLWDDPDRSNRSLKRTAPPAPASNKKESTCPPTKKAKASSPVSPENVPKLPPTSFHDASRMVQEAWKVAFPSLRFPVELIGLFPPLRHQPTTNHPPALTHQPTKLKVEINKNLESQFLKECAFFKALKATVARVQTESTSQTRRLLAAFAASHPQVSVIHQEILIALACYTFLLDVQAQASCEKDGKNIDFSWLQLTNLSNCSPSASSLTNWVTKLAQEQYILFSAKMEHANVFSQSDGRQKGQEVRLFTLLEESDTTHSENVSICQFWAGVTYTGKTNAAVAKGTHHSFKKFVRPLKQISGCCGDLGAGTPGSYAKSLEALGI